MIWWVSPSQVRTLCSNLLASKRTNTGLKNQRAFYEILGPREQIRVGGWEGKNRVKHFFWAKKNGPRPKVIIHGASDETPAASAVSTSGRRPAKESSTGGSQWRTRLSGLTHPESSKKLPWTHAFSRCCVLGHLCGTVSRKSTSTHLGL